MYLREWGNFTSHYKDADIIKALLTISPDKEQHNVYLFRYNTTWRMDYDTVKGIADSIMPSFTEPLTGKREEANGSICWDNHYSPLLSEESASLSVFGYCTAVEEVVLLDLFKGTDIANLYVFDFDKSKYLSKEGKVCLKLFDTFMDMLEIRGYADVSKRQGLSLFKNYIQQQQGIVRSDSSRQAAEAEFERLSFCPDLMKFDNGEPVPKYRF